MNLRKDNIRALVFDLDDTLYNASEAYSAALNNIGLSSQQADFLAARKIVKERLGNGHTSARDRLLYFKVFLESTGQYSTNKLFELMNGYEQALAHNISKQWLALGYHTTLSKLKTQFELFMITNENTRTQLLKMQAIDPEASLFKHIVTSGEIGVEKPDAKIFQFLFAQHQLKASECIMIGDDYEKDILAAKSLGMQAIWTHEFNPDSTKTIDTQSPSMDTLQTIHTLSELETLL